MHCINKLYKLPVNVNHLQETGVGKTVNSLRKIEGEKGLGDAAKALVAKWKTMVMLEDEAERKQREESSGPSEEDLKRIKLIREAEKSEQKKTDNNVPKSFQSPSFDYHKSHESSKKHKSESLDSKNRKRKLDGDGDDKHQSKRREISYECNNTEKHSTDNIEHKDVKSKSKSHSSSSNGHSSSKNNDRSNHKSSSSSHKSYESSEKKKSRDGESETRSSSSKSLTNNSSSKHHKSSNKEERKDKTKSSKTYPENDGFDSQSGEV